MFAKQSLFIYLLISIAACIFIYDAKLYGDIFRNLYIFLALILIYQKSWDKFIILCISSAIVCIIVFLIKHGFTYIANHYGEEYALISKRPINGAFNGFPSGHSATAFMAIGFMCHFYKKQWIAVCLLIAIFVAISRVITSWHTITQVVCGAIIALIISYICTNKLKQYIAKS